MRGSITPFLALVLLVTLCSANDEICYGVEDLTYVRSRISCEYYYACVGGTAYGYRCPEGLWFSMEQQMCVQPEDSDCDIEQPPDLPTAPPPTPSPECDGVPDYRYVRSFESCQYYYQCIDEIAYLLSCPKGFWFNEEHQRCGSRFEFECDIETPTPTVPTTPTPSPPPSNPCFNEPNFGFIDDPDYCYRFHMCLLGVPFPMVCWDGLWFDYESQTCVEPSVTDCNAATPPPNPPPMPNVCQNVDDDVSVLHPRFCNAYFVCSNEEAGEPSYCPNGDWFDAEHQGCRHPMDAYCPHNLLPPPTPDVCTGVDDGFLVRAPDSCSYHYVCSNDIGYRLSCPPDQYFDEHRQMCDDRENVYCPLLVLN